VPVDQAQAGHPVVPVPADQAQADHPAVPEAQHHVDSAQ
jgi:hypothetical protein